MGLEDGAGGAGAVFRSVAEALRAAIVSAQYLNSPAAALVDGPGCGEVLEALGRIQSLLTAAQAGFLRRFDAAARYCTATHHPATHPPPHAADRARAG